MDLDAVPSTGEMTQKLSSQATSTGTVNNKPQAELASEVWKTLAQVRNTVLYVHTGNMTCMRCPPADVTAMLNVYGD